MCFVQAGRQGGVFYAPRLVWQADGEVWVPHQSWRTKHNSACTKRTSAPFEKQVMHKVTLSAHSAQMMLQVCSTPRWHEEHDVSGLST